MYNSSNPMLKGYLSSQERDQMRERERLSRSQIAQQASRDSFMEQTGGATFSQPVRVKPNDRQISNILGEFDQVAPIMRSESACASLVGAYAMPCTPAPALQDHDHLFVPPPSPAPSLPPPPPPPPRHERRPEPASRARAAPAHFTAPAAPAPLGSHAPRQQRALHNADQRPGLDLIFQEMMVPGPITPLKTCTAPFAFPGAQVLPPVTPLHKPSSDARAPSPRGQRRWRSPRALAAPDPAPPPAAPVAAPVAAISDSARTTTSLHDDLTLSDDSDDETTTRGGGQRRSDPVPVSRSSVAVTCAVSASGVPASTATTIPAPPAAGVKSAATASSASSSESDSESAESEESDSETEQPPPAVASPAASLHSPLDAKEGSESPSTNAGSKWSLLSIMNKDTGATPVSSIFENTPARSASKLSPHDFPSSADPAERNDADISLEDIVSQVKTPMEMSPACSASSSSSEAVSDAEAECEPDPPVVTASSRMTTGGKRPRPRISALSESDSEKMERSKRRPEAAAVTAAKPSQVTSAKKKPARTKAKVKMPAVKGSDDDSEDEQVQKRPAAATAAKPASRRVPSKGSLKGHAPAPPRPRGRPPKDQSQRSAPEPQSREILSTTSDSSDDESAAAVTRVRPAAAQLPWRSDPSPAAGRGKPAAAAPSVPATRLSADDETATGPAPSSPKPAAATNAAGASSDSDSPPKLDAGGVSTSDANKKATFSRLFSHRISGKRGTPRSRRGGATSASERSEGQASPAPGAVALPPLTRHNGVPVLRCRIQRWLVTVPQGRRQPAQPGVQATTPSPRPEPTSRVEREPKPPPQEAAAVASDRKLTPRQGPEATPETASPPVQKRRRRSRHHRHEEVPAKACLPSGGDISLRSHSSCSSRAADDVIQHHDDVPVTSHASKRRRAAEAETAKTPSSGGQQESRIESPPTGVREADSSTNPTVTQHYDVNVPAALYTNQPFPIPADQHQYLKQARRLKRAADNEADMTLKLIRYTQAVIYFLLTALSMEKDSDDSEAMLAMLYDTLKLIKDMLRLSSATYRKQGKRPTHIDQKLQTLLLRCQALIYLRMFKLTEVEHKRAQRQISEFKSQMPTESLELGGTCSVPRELVQLMLRCNEQQTHLQNWLDYWEQADALMQMAQDTAEFFSDLDRTMGGLLATSSLLELVYYVRETTRRLQDMHSRAVV